MKKTYTICIEPATITRQGLRNIEKYLSELESIEGIEVDEIKLEFTCDSDKEELLIPLAENYSIVNLIGLFDNEKH